jgi:predicted GNAT family N-acyltransferase
VFCGEQGVPEAADRDGRDGEATHLVAVEGGRVVGTCRLLFKRRVAWLGRLAVEPDARRHGVGAQILDAASRVALDGGAKRMELHAQTYARELYERDGYVDCSEEFVEEGIPHVAMRKALA